MAHSMDVCPPGSMPTQDTNSCPTLQACFVFFQRAIRQISWWAADWMWVNFTHWLIIVSPSYSFRASSAKRWKALASAAVTDAPPSTIAKQLKTNQASKQTHLLRLTPQPPSSRFTSPTPIPPQVHTKTLSVHSLNGCFVLQLKANRRLSCGGRGEAKHRADSTLPILATIFD